jgi:tetratricopeptide (TPR) repeat protein
MAKHRRPPARPKRAQATTTGRPSRGVPPGTHRPAEGGEPAAAGSPPDLPPQRRSTYFEAVALYEQGLARLQLHDYGGALRLFEEVLERYPDEKELHERVRLYQNICRRHTASEQPGPQTLEERLFASTLAINGGRYDEAISHLRLVRDEDPDNDHALYMLAVAHAQRGELAEAVAHLERAIAVNPENRALARHDRDLDPLRDDEAFRAATETPPPPRMERRRPLRSRSVR